MADSIKKVKPRYDRGGTVFGAMHRLLNVKFLMTDIDGTLQIDDSDVSYSDSNHFLEYRLIDGVTTVLARYELKYVGTKGANAGKKLTNSLNALNKQKATSLHCLIDECHRQATPLFLVGCGSMNSGSPWYFVRLKKEDNLYTYHFMGDPLVLKDDLFDLVRRVNDKDADAIKRTHDIKIEIHQYFKDVLGINERRFLDLVSVKQVNTSQDDILDALILINKLQAKSYQGSLFDL